MLKILEKYPSIQFQPSRSIDHETFIKISLLLDYKATKDVFNSLTYQNENPFQLLHIALEDLKNST